MQITDNRTNKIVTLCGSTKFKDEFIRANFLLTMKGYIVLSVGWFGHSKENVFTVTSVEKEFLDDLHKRKIELSDEVFIIDVDGYIGNSTRSEIAHAKTLQLPIFYLSKDNDYFKLEG